MKKIFISIMALIALMPLWSNAQDGMTFYIQSAQEYGKGNDGFWDVPGRNVTFKSGQNLQVYNLGDRDGDRKFKFIYVGSWGGEKYYRIQPQHAFNASVDVQGNNHKNGNQVFIWENNNSEAQRFRLQNMGNGRWKIISSHGFVVCLDGRRSSNGTNVHLWADHDGPWMEWMLIDVRTGAPFGKEHQHVKKPARQGSNSGTTIRKSL